MLEQMKTDYEASDLQYAEYINVMKNTGVEQVNKLSGLRTMFDSKQDEIRDLQTVIEEFKVRLAHIQGETDGLNAIDYSNRVRDLE
jgi:uncharacterized coiled-coil DUF342 family protein